MSVSDDLKFKIGLTVVVLAGTGLALWYAKNQVTQAGGKVLDAAKAMVPYVDPTDPRKVVYSGVNAVGGAITGDSNFSLGAWIYDVTHPQQARPQDSYQIPVDFGVKEPGSWD